MKKRAFLLLMTAALLLAAVSFAQEDPSARVFDYAGLFSADDAETLSAAILDFQENTGYDFAILVTNEDLGTPDYQQLCDDFVVDHALGLGMNQTALLCYLDLYGDGYYYISAYGDLKNLMVTEDIQYLASTGMEYFVKGDITGGFLWTVNMLAEALIHIGTMNETVRVYDYAELLTEDEVAALESAIADFRALSGADFLYLSTYEDLQGNEDGEYMAGFYQSHGFGDGDNRSGVMMYLDLYNDSYYVQNFGNMDVVVSQEALNQIVSDSNASMSEGKVLDAVLQVIGAYSAYFQ